MMFFRASACRSWRGSGVVKGRWCRRETTSRKLASLVSRQNIQVSGFRKPVVDINEARSYFRQNMFRWFSSAQELGEAEYHQLADELLESLEPAFEELPGFEDFDVMYSQGVLTLDLGSHGTWVLNKQTPNRQIWWSSPLSGPKRYYYDSTDSTWKNTRDGHNLLELLNKEISSIFKTTLRL